MPLVDILAIAATVAGVTMAVAPMLQMRHMRRTQSSADVSVVYLSVIDSGFIIWFAYGLSLGNAAMIISNTASFTFLTTTIAMALYYRRGHGTAATPSVTDGPAR